MNRTIRTGLVLLGILSLLDVAGPAWTDGEHPPMSVAVIGAVIGVLSLGLLLPAWRGSSGALNALIGLRLLSALTAVPAFFVDDAPVIAQVVAGAWVALTVLGIVLCLPARRAVEVAR